MTAPDAKTAFKNNRQLFVTNELLVWTKPFCFFFLFIIIHLNAAEAETGARTIYTHISIIDAAAIVCVQPAHFMHEQKSTGKNIFQVGTERV